MNSENERYIGTGKCPSLSAVELVETGELPEYVCDIYRKANGLDPRLANKIFKRWDIIEKVLFVTMLMELAVFINTLTGKIHFPSAAVRDGTLILTLAGTIGSFVIVSCRYPLREKLLDGFQTAMFWILRAHPMTRHEFPENETLLRLMYIAILEDMAKLTLFLQHRGDSYKAAAETAREELKMLHKGACCLGFIKRSDRKKGLALAFEGACRSKGYRFLDAEKWIEDFNRQRALDPTPFWVARRA